MEIWKPVPEFENYYEVSNLGQIRSCNREVVCKDGKIKHLKGRILKPSRGTYGRNQYTLSKDDKKLNVRGYQIVAQVFLPQPNMTNMEINHIDGNNTNDAVTNLEWVTPQENLQHALEHGLFNTYYNRTTIKGEKGIMMKENTKKVFNYLQNTKEDVTAADVAAALGLEKKSVDGIFTAAIQRKELGYREEAEIELEDGTHQKVKFLRLNDGGMAVDTNAEEE